MPKGLWMASLIAGAAAAAACGGSELEFADWTFPVPEGTAVFEYAPVPLEEREGRIVEAVEDLVLGSDLSDPQQVFYRASAVVPDVDGNIYVLDSDSHRVQVFDAGGAYLRSLGREGQGPGEFEGPSGLSITGDHVVVKASRLRLSVWTRDGKHVRDRLLDESLLSLTGTDDGLVGYYAARSGAPGPAGERPPRRGTYAAFDPEGEQTGVFVEFDEPPPTDIQMGAATLSISSGFPIRTWLPRFAAADDGSFYFTVSDEYQIHALGPTDTTGPAAMAPWRWSLRVAWPRLPVTVEHRDTVTAGFTGMLQQLDPGELEWAERFPAIDNVEVDGHGHVYVFPFFAPLDAPFGRDEERPVLDRPVDVFSADGERLFSGMISVADWTGALGDYVYRLRLSDSTDEYEVVRHELIEPFR